MHCLSDCLALGRTARGNTILRRGLYPEAAVESVPSASRWL
jgi:hypothetical protein